MTLLERLKAETRPAHDRIENALDLERRIATRDGYKELLIRFYGFHSAWEKAAGRIVSDKAIFESRCRTKLLSKDLAALGLRDEEIIRLPQCAPLMPLPSPAAVLGGMYVVEGSTLGGVVIAREVERKLGLDAETGCAYFGSHGRETAMMWNHFKEKLLSASSRETDDVIVATAQKTFAVMHDWLCEAP